MALLATLVVVLLIGSYAAITHYRIYRENQQANRRLMKQANRRLIDLRNERLHKGHGFEPWQYIQGCPCDECLAVE